MRVRRTGAGRGSYGSYGFARVGRDPFGHHAGRPGHRARARPGQARPRDDPAGPLARQDSARALVSQPGLIPLVILRGSGDSTRALAAEAARHGVRTMAHADGGAVLYVDMAADLDLAEELIEASLDRLGVCNRLNLLLVHPDRWDSLVPLAVTLLDRLGIGRASCRERG